MNASSKSPATRLRKVLGIGLLTAVAAAAAFAIPAVFLKAESASAHCDAMNGPVVTSARQALEEKDVTLILPYVKAEQEKELTEAFEATLAIRNRGGGVKEIADQWFFETAVRLHRVGEGASYTGIKDHAEENAALDAAEKSLEAGTPDAVIDLLDEELRAKVAARFEHVLEAREAEKANPSVETSRERVEAELLFEKYVVGIGGAIDAEASHEGEGAATPAEGEGHTE